MRRRFFVRVPALFGDGARRKRFLRARKMFFARVGCGTFVVLLVELPGFGSSIWITATPEHRSPSPGHLEGETPCTRSVEPSRQRSQPAPLPNYGTKDDSSNIAGCLSAGRRDCNSPVPATSHIPHRLCGPLVHSAASPSTPPPRSSHPITWLTPNEGWNPQHPAATTSIYRR